MGWGGNKTKSPPPGALHHATEQALILNKGETA